MTIDRDRLASVATLADDLGVLSLYVNADPTAQAQRPTAWEVEIKNQLAEIVSLVKTDETRERASAILAGLDDLTSEIERVTHPSTHGRGRALFAALDGATTIAFEFQVPIETRVVFSTTAFIRPLLAAFERGRPAGFVTLSRSEVVLYGWDSGTLELIERWSVDLETDDWRRMQGPAASQPQMSQQTAPQHDRFQRRREEHRAGLIADVAMEVANHREARAWGRLVLAGDAKLRAALKSGLPSSSRGEALETDQKLEKLSIAQLESALVPELDRARAAQRVETATRVDGLARSGGAATTGVRATVAALAEGRVGELLIERGRDYMGVRAPDGTLYAERASAIGVEASELIDEPLLGERMVERALAIGADVLTLEPDEALPLAEADGVGALLRW